MALSERKNTQLDIIPVDSLITEIENPRLTELARSTRRGINARIDRALNDKRHEVMLFEYAHDGAPKQALDENGYKTYDKLPARLFHDAVYGALDGRGRIANDFNEVIIPDSDPTFLRQTIHISKTEDVAFISIDLFDENREQIKTTVFAKHVVKKPIEIEERIDSNAPPWWKHRKTTNINEGFDF